MSAVRYLSVKEVLRIHYRVIAQFGGSHGVRDLGLLESAVARPQAGFGDFEAYPDLFSKAAVLLHSLAKNHAFVDGNKRTSLVSGRIFLKRNGWRLRADHVELEQFVLQTATGTITEPAITAWLARHSTKSSDALR